MFNIVAVLSGSRMWMGQPHREEAAFGASNGISLGVVKAKPSVLILGKENSPPCTLLLAGGGHLHSGKLLFFVFFVAVASSDNGSVDSCTRSPGKQSHFLKF